VTTVSRRRAAVDWSRWFPGVPGQERAASRPAAGLKKPNLLTIPGGTDRRWSRTQKGRSHEHHQDDPRRPVRHLRPGDRQRRQRGARQDRYARSGQLELYYEVHGSGGGVPVVLIHGSFCTIEICFAPVIQGLADKRQMIAFEQQGHGRTRMLPKHPFTVTQMVKDTVAVMNLVTGMIETFLDEK
jgi:hypothetical protein